MQINMAGEPRMQTQSVKLVVTYHVWNFESIN